MIIGKQCETRDSKLLSSFIRSMCTRISGSAGCPYHQYLSPICRGYTYICKSIVFSLSLSFFIYLCGRHSVYFIRFSNHVIVKIHDFVQIAHDFLFLYTLYNTKRNRSRILCVKNRKLRIYVFP